MSAGQRIVFANELRGLAAVAVAISHLLGVFWLMRDAVSAATFTPAQLGPNHPWALSIVFPWFNFGPFGVGLFFLISGLVIPFSLDSHTRGTFLLARLLRIYPTYIAAVLLETALLAGNAHLWGIPFGLGAWTVISNALLIHDLVGQPSLDLVNWTLCIELRFYLVMAVCAPAIRRGSVATVFAVALLACAINLAVAAGAFGPPLPDPLLPAYTASTEAMFVVFMLMGVLFNFHLRGLLRTPALLLGIVALGTLFVFCWETSVLAFQLPGVAANYFCALALFAALYGLRRVVPRMPILDALADVSYPLYIVHALTGYSVMRLLMLRWHAPYPLALLAGVAAILAVATALHLAIERPTIRMGRQLQPSRARPRLARVAAE